jgi:hypothetical protein
VSDSWDQQLIEQQLQELPSPDEATLQRLEYESYLRYKADVYGKRRFYREEAAANHIRMIARLSEVDVDEPDELPTVGVFGPELGQALFYRGQFNGIHGKGGTMKSYIACYVALQKVRSDPGTCALLFDFEVGLKRTGKRLKALGASEEERDGIIWFRPSAEFTPADKQDLLDMVAAVGQEPTFAVWDAVSTAMSGLSGNKGEDVNSWLAAVPGWVLSVWPDITILLIDHLSKDAPESLHPTGAVQKFNAIQGAQYLAKMTRKASKTEDGFTTLTCAKDQEGNHTVGDVIAQYDMGPSNPEGKLQVPTGQIKKEAREAKEAEAKSAIVDALLGADDGVLTSTELKVACGGNAALHTRMRDAMATGSVHEPAQLGHSKSGKTVTYWLTDPKAWITLDLDQAEERSHWSKSKKVTK